MAHARTQLRALVVSAVTGLPSTGATVFANAVYTFDTLPALNVVIEDEAVRDDLSAMGDSSQYRDLTVVVEARAADAVSPDDDLDQICNEVENAIYTDAGLAGVIHDVTLISTDIEFTGDGDQPVGIARMFFSILFETDASDPQILIS